MFQNQLKTAFRNLLKNKGFTLLNVLGLTLGLATCLLIVFYVADELSYDRYNTKSDRIVRVNTDAKFGIEGTSFAITAPVVGEALQNSFPEIEKSVRLFATDGLSFKKGNAIVPEPRVAYADPGFFDVFTLPMITGNPATALTEPHSVVITESTAKKYFNSTQVTGQTMVLANDDHTTTPLTITAVIRDIPSQSHFHFDLFLSMTSSNESKSKNFYALYNFSTYLLLQPGADYKKLQAKFPDWLRMTLSAPYYGYEENERRGQYYRLNLTPLKEIHLQSNRSNELGRNGNLQYVYIFLAIAVFILVIACINFMNLSTARSANRAREVGVRKVLGAPRAYLIAQFLSESILIAFAATLLAILAAWALLPFFNQLSGKELALTPSTFAWLLSSLLVISLIIGVLAGSYPAFFLSAFRPVDVLKGKLSLGFKGGGLRSFLVVFQFSISIFLIAGTLVIYNQLKYIQNKDLGFKRQQVLIVKNTGVLDNPLLLKQEVRQLPGVESATLTAFLPTGGQRWHNFANTPTNENSLQTEFWPVDEDYLHTMGMANFPNADLSIRVNTANLPALLARIESTWKTMSPHQAFDYSFMDKDFDTLYRDEQHMGQLFISFTTLAILIACLGLFGLAAYAAEQRTREIGIRKVLGAGVSSVVALLSKDFLRLVVLSMLLATPLAWWAMQKWLQNFAYRESIHWWVFLAAGSGALLVATITVSTQAFKAARTNPVESLRGD